jgi:hypothetical protein
MKTRAILVGIFLLIGSLTAWFAAGVQAAPLSQVQQVNSPTPGPDGRILYIVQEGDNCGKISLLFGVSIEYLRVTNHLDENCTLQSGKAIMIGMGGPGASSPTPGPSPTPTPIPPTVTPQVGGLAQVCVLLYADLNGDGLRQSTEPAIAGGALSLTSLSGTYSKTLTTTVPSDPNAYQGTCFTDVPEGKYTVSAGVPDGYNPTTDMTSTLDEVRAGETINVDFGAQVKTSPQNSGDGAGRSPILGILGVLFLIGGVGLGVYAWRVMRK